MRLGYLENMLVFTFFSLLLACYFLLCQKHTEKGKGYHSIIFEEHCLHHVLKVWIWPGSKDCYLYKDMMTRLLTSISLRSTLDMMDSFNNLNPLRSPVSIKPKEKPSFTLFGMEKMYIMYFVYLL